MKKISYLLAVIILAIPFSAIAADVIKMKNGDVFRGDVIEQKFGKHIQLKLADGNEKRVKWNEIESTEIGQTSGTVTLKNGDVVRGEIIEQKFGKYLQIKTNDGNEKRLAWSKISGIKYGEVEESSEAPSKAEPKHAEADQAPRVSSRTDKLGYFGLIFGMTRMNTDGADSRGEFSYGFDAGYGAFGVFLQTFKDSASGADTTGVTGAAEITASARAMTFGGEFIGRNLFSSPAFFGARAGFTRQSISVDDSNGTNMLSASNMAPTFGPVLGFDYKIGEFSFGADFSWLFALESKMNITYSGTTSEQTIPSYNLINLFASAKVWF